MKVLLILFSKGVNWYQIKGMVSQAWAPECH